MTEVFSFTRGDTPLFVSIPHDGRELASGQQERMTDAGLALPDTDWHVRELYSFADDIGASVIAANYSRYVIDLNRPADDRALYDGQVSTGLCPVRTFAGEDIYLPGENVDDAERAARTKAFWQPYHDRLSVALDELRQAHGFALLWDAHSIPSQVPRLFDGVLPDLNIGTNDGASCAASAADAVARIAAASPYSSVLDGRFRGGYITRHYGEPEHNVHAIQLEIAQKTYMDEASQAFDPDRAASLSGTLRDMLGAFLAEIG